MKYAILVALCVVVFSSGHLRAQPYTLNERIQPIELQLMDYKKDDPKEKGRINVTSVTQTKDTMYFFVKGLSMYSPAYFGITAVKGSAPVVVNLHKENWNQADKNGETDGSQYWHTSFKTEGDFGIMVVPKEKPVTYTLVTWVGAEAKDVGIGSAFKGEGASVAPPGPSKPTAGKNFFQKNLVYIILGVVIVALLAYIFIKRKK